MSCASLSINLVPIGSVKMTRVFSLSWRMTVIISGVEERCILWEWGLFQGPESAPWSWSGLCYFQQRSRVIDFLWEVISQVLPPPESPHLPFPGLRCAHTHLCYIPDHVFCYSTDFLDRCHHYFHDKIPVHASGGQKFAQKEWVFSLHFSLLTEMIYSRRIEV